MTAAAPENEKKSWPRLEAWLGRRRRVTLMLLLALALLFRLIYFAQLSTSPCLNVHRVNGLDQQLFHNWARHLASGDWLQRTPQHPQALWMDKLADLCLEQNPNLPLELGLTTTDDYYPPQMREQLWNYWLKGSAYHQEPLYPYLVALTYRFLGEDVRWVFAWQLLLGMANVALIYGIARRCFGNAVALLSGITAVVYGPLMFYELVLLRATLITFTGLLLVYLAIRIRANDSSGRWFALGLVLGASLLLKTIFAVWFVFLAAWIIHKHRAKRGRAAKLILSFAAGVTLALAPIVARNSAVGTPLFNWCGSAVIVFSIPHTADAPPYSFYVSMRDMPGVLIRSKGRVFPAFIAAVSTHKSVSSFATLVARKFAYIWYKHEVPNNVNFYFYQIEASILRYLSFPYAAIAVLGLAGMVMTLSRWRTCWPLYVLIATGITSMLVISVMSRFRVPMAVGLMPFAALALMQILHWLIAGQRRRALVVSLLLLLLGLWCAGPLPRKIKVLRYWDFYVAYMAKHGPQLVQEHGEIGAAHLRLRRFEEAASAFRKAVQIDYHHGRSHYNLGVALEGLGQTKAALAEYESAVRAQPQNARLRQLVEIALARLEKSERARRSAKPEK